MVLKTNLIKNPNKTAYLFTQKISIYNQKELKHVKKT